MEALRIGVAGAGVLGAYHIEKCRKRADLILAGVCDPDPARRSTAAERFGVSTYGDIEELLPHVDAVIVASPASTHGRVALAALRAGRHVLVEKPLASSVDEGEALTAAARDKGLVLHVGHSELYNPAFKRLLSYMPAPKFMEIHRLAAFSPRGTDVSVVLDLMVHDLYLVQRLLHGEEPEAAAIAAAGVPVLSGDIDIANVRMPYPSGCVVNLTASRISLAKMRKLRIFQEKSYFSVDLDSREIVHCCVAESPRPGAMPIEMRKELVEQSDALEEEHDSFVGALRGRESGGTTGAEALQVLRIADSIMQRLRNSSGGQGG